MTDRLAQATAYVLEHAKDDAYAFQRVLDKAVELFEVRQIDLENNIDQLFMNEDTEILNENLEKIISNNETYRLVIEDIIK